MKFSTTLISMFAAVSAVTAYGGSDIYARDLADLDAQEAYSLGFLYARSLFEDDEFELYAREPLNRPGHPVLPPGTAAKANSDYAARVRVGQGQHQPSDHSVLPQRYNPHRPGTPNPNPGKSFFSAADSAAVGRGPGARYKRSLYDDYDFDY